MSLGHNGRNGDHRDKRWDGWMNYGCGTWLFVGLLVFGVLVWLCFAAMVARSD
jgi:hypothetical protein